MSAQYEFNCTLVHLQNGRYEPYGTIRVYAMTPEEQDLVFSAGGLKSSTIIDHNNRAVYWLAPQGMVEMCTLEDITRWDGDGVFSAPFRWGALKPKPFYRKLEGKKW